MVASVDTNSQTNQTPISSAGGSAVGATIVFPSGSDSSTPTMGNLFQQILIGVVVALGVGFVLKKLHAKG